MSVIHKHTIKAVATNFELSCIFGLVITLGDFVWLIHDVIDNGISTTYCVVGMLLIVGMLGLVYIIYRHNISLVRRLNRKLLAHKIKVVHKKIKHI